MSQGPVVEVTFTATIRLYENEVAAGHGSLAQAVQNMVGPAGAQVMEVESYGAAAAMTGGEQSG